MKFQKKKPHVIYWVGCDDLMDHFYKNFYIKKTLLEK